MHVICKHTIEETGLAFYSIVIKVYIFIYFFISIGSLHSEAYTGIIWPLQRLQYSLFFEFSGSQSSFTIVQYQTIVVFLCFCKSFQNKAKYNVFPVLLPYVKKEFFTLMFWNPLSELTFQRICQMCFDIICMFHVLYFLL